MLNKTVIEWVGVNSHPWPAGTGPGLYKQIVVNWDELKNSKAYTELTVVMCCRIICRMSVAPSSGNFQRRPAMWYACGQDQEF